MARRSTAQKEIIFQALKSLDHPTATEVYDVVHKQASQISLGTVYRNLNMMYEDGNALRISIQDQPDRFDPNVHDHHHAICNSCGKVIDTNSKVPPALIAQLEQAVEQSTGVKVSGHSLFFRGVCKDCQGSRDVSKGTGRAAAPNKMAQ